jgi:hypothetical protein
MRPIQKTPFTSIAEFCKHPHPHLSFLLQFLAHLESLETSCGRHIAVVKGSFCFVDTLKLLRNNLLQPWSGSVAHIHHCSPELLVMVQAPLQSQGAPMRNRLLQITMTYLMKASR